MRDESMAVNQAIYRRDNEVFRMSVFWTTVVSLASIGCVLAPALVASTPESLSLILIVLFLWRQRLLDTVASLGRLAWTKTVWQSATGTSFTDLLDAADETE